MTMQTQEPAPGVAGPNLGGKYLTFALGEESYAVDVRKVREIIRLTDITFVPQMPACIRGVINLRGKIIPVIDLRVRFGLASAATTDKTCIVVVQIQTGTSLRRETGLIVDNVEEVMNLGASEIEATPDFGAQVNTEYLLGMAKLKGRVKMLLDLDRVLGADALQALHQPAQADTPA
jgi:purine-binding chemotaxis protein CheW